MKKVAALLIVCMMALPVLSGCGNSGSDSTVEVKAPTYALTDFAYQADTGAYAFDFNLFRQVVKEEGATNLVLSPLSARVALAMAYNGAEGQAKEEMARVLGFEGLSLEEVNQRMSELMAQLESNGFVKVDLANSMWANDPINPDFAARVSQWYGAQAESVEEWDGSAIKRMNQWVSDNTGGKITEMIKEVDPYTALILLNALYFNGQWLTAFDPALTEEAGFHLPDGSTAQVPMMHQSEMECEYYEDEELQMVSIPFRGSDTDMCVILPRESQQLSDVIEGLDTAKWERITRNAFPGECDIALPSFRMEYEKELSNTLKALGMEEAFQDGFGDIVQALGPTYIGKVLQKAWIEVDEEGAEAAAATEVEIRTLGESINRSITVDRPFIFVIRDKLTGSPLFMGTIVSP